MTMIPLESRLALATPLPWLTKCGADSYGAGRDAVIARREASARGHRADDKMAVRRAPGRAVEEARIRAARESQAPNHGEDMQKRTGSIRERASDSVRTDFNVALRERNQEDAKIKKSNLVRTMRSDIKLIESIKVKQIARLRAFEKARLEEIELKRKIKIIVKLQRIFRHYLPIRIARLLKALEAKTALSGAPGKLIHKTLGKVNLTRAQQETLQKDAA